MLERESGEWSDYCLDDVFRNVSPKVQYSFKEDCSYHNHWFGYLEYNRHSNVEGIPCYEVSVEIYLPPWKPSRWRISFLT